MFDSAKIDDRQLTLIAKKESFFYISCFSDTMWSKSTGSICTGGASAAISL